MLGVFAYWIISMVLIPVGIILMVIGFYFNPLRRTPERVSTFQVLVMGLLFSGGLFCVLTGYLFMGTCLGTVGNDDVRDAYISLKQLIGGHDEGSSEI